MAKNKTPPNSIHSAKLARDNTTSASSAVLSELAKPQSIADAHRFRSDAARQRTTAKYYEAQNDPGGALMCIAEAEAIEMIADKFLSLSETPTIGTGGELMPTGRDADVVPGLVNTVKNPDKTIETASRTRINLADKAGVFDLAFDMAETIQAKNSIEKALSHQMAAAHDCAMNLVAEIHCQKLSVEKVRLTNAAARMMTTYQEGALTIFKLRGGGQQKVTVVHQHVQVAGGQVAVTGAMEQKKSDDKK